MLNHMTGGAWGIVVRRIFEAGSRTIPLLMVLFVPLIFAMTTLYSWTDPEVMNANPFLLSKKPYLNENFFLLRAAIYFVVWIVLALALNHLSRQQDETKDPGLTRRLQGLSGVGTLLYVITSTFRYFRLGNVAGSHVVLEYLWFLVRHHACFDNVLPGCHCLGAGS